MGIGRKALVFSGQLQTPSPSESRNHLAESLFFEEVPQNQAWGVVLHPRMQSYLLKTQSLLLTRLEQLLKQISRLSRDPLWKLKVPAQHLPYHLSHHHIFEGHSPCQHSVQNHSTTPEVAVLHGVVFSQKGRGV